ncbi:MAG: acyl-CoA dehydrogenase family protein [Myxococcota bacterium]
MITFKPSEEQAVARDVMRDFALSAMRPLARECDEESKISEAFLAQSWELGLVTTQIPEAYGGAGEARSPLTNTLVLEELAFGDVALALAALAPAGFVYALVDQGSEEQKKRYLPAFCTESYRAAALAVAEPGPAFDAFAPRTEAEARGEGFVLHGTKCFVPMGDRATHFLVVARNRDRLDAFIVPRDAAGLSVSAPEKNLGVRALPTATLELEGVEVPAADRLGGEKGSDVTRLLNHSRAALGAAMVGLSRAALEYAVPYAKGREAFDQAIAQKQGIAFKLADMHIETEATRWLVWKVASQLEQGLDATRAAHMARAYAAEKSMWITDQGLQVLGGHGFIREHPVELWYRNARTLGVLEGTVSV